MILGPSGRPLERYLAKGMPFITLPSGKTVDGPHCEYLRFRVLHKRLLDTWEGGDVYRNAKYGPDRDGYEIGNLLRHKRDYPVPGCSQADREATESDYQSRLARTPVPTFFAEVLNMYLGKIFAREVKRKAPDDVTKWWKSVNYRGESIDDWWRDTIAPIFMTLGQLDIKCELPEVDPDERISSQADMERVGLTGCVASHILPENMLWWKLQRNGSYAECIVREVDDDECQYRWWGPDSWVLYDDDGYRIKSGEHKTGVVPITRIFDRRRPRCCNTGLPRLESIAEQVRNYFNRDSELALSDTNQAFPLLQAPEEYCKGGNMIGVGPNNLMPMKGLKGPSGVEGYQGFEYVDVPKGSSDSIRTNLQMIVDAVDRTACRTKPAGSPGTSGGTVSQSGISKQMDDATGNDLLSAIACTMARCEKQVATLAYRVMNDGRLPKDGEIDIVYPTEFALLAGPELADRLAKFMLNANAAGSAPTIEAAYLKREVRADLPGHDDATFAAFDKEIDALVERGAAMPDPNATPNQDPNQVPNGPGGY